MPNSIDAQAQALDPQAGQPVINMRAARPKKKKREIRIFERITNKELVFFSREFSILLNASVPIVETLNILEKQTKNAKFERIISDVSNRVESGSSLSAAMAEYPKVFDNLFISLIKTGEVSGTLDKSLTYIADQQEKDYNLRRKIKGAMTYPAFVLTAMAGVLGLLFTFVMPKMILMLQEAGAELPLTTKILVFTTNIISNYIIFFAAAVILGIMAFRFIIHRPKGGLWWDRTKLRLPVIGNFLQKVYIERFARNFAILVNGGVPVVHSLKITAEAIGNKAYTKALMNVAEEVENGRPIAEALQDHPDYIPDLVVEMVGIGERTSKIYEILSKIAVFYEQEADQSVNNLTQLLEPLVMLVLGGIVAVIVSGILLPIYNMMNIQ